MMLLEMRTMLGMMMSSVGPRSCLSLFWTYICWFCIYSCFLLWCGFELVMHPCNFVFLSICLWFSCICCFRTVQVTKTLSVVSFRRITPVVRRFSSMIQRIALSVRRFALVPHYACQVHFRASFSLFKLILPASPLPFQLHFLQNVLRPSNNYTQSSKAWIGITGWS